MAEYIEREAVLEFVEPDARPFLAERIKSIPAADVVPTDFHERCLQIEIQKRMALEKADVREVVYCKDCRHRDPEDKKCDCGQLERAGCVFPVDDEYFCAYGEES